MAVMERDGKQLGVDGKIGSEKYLHINVRITLHFAHVGWAGSITTRGFYNFSTIHI